MTKVLEKKPNLKQQECIDNINGQIMVLAGPGTGKTFTLIERIKNMINNHSIAPEKILCLTFSDAAANEMKIRLISDIGPLAGEVNVYTYHSFCNEIISKYPDEFIEYTNAKLITAPIQYTLTKQAIDELDVKSLRSSNYNPYLFIPQIIDAINEIKKNLYTKETFYQNLEIHPQWGKLIAELTIKVEEKLIKGNNAVKTDLKTIEEKKLKIEQAKEVWKIYEHYTYLMRKNNLIDFSDMINLVLEKCQKSPVFAQKIANEYDYFLVDEYQDTNLSQNLIVFTLTKASSTKNIFVVGDDDQIIYGFQGAQLDNVEKFLDNFPETKVVCLTENMRSTQNILDYSYQVLQGDYSRLENNPKYSKYNINKKLIAKNPNLIDKNQKIKFNQFQELSQEREYIINDIENLIKSNQLLKNGVQNLSNIAIIATKNSELLEFAQRLKNKNIPFELKNETNILEIKAPSLLIMYIELLVKPTENADKLFSLLLNRPFSINPRDYEKLIREKMRHKNALFVDDMRIFKEADLIEFEKIKQFIETYDYLKVYATSENLKNSIIEIINKTGILKYFLENNINQFENIMGLKRIVDITQELCDFNPRATIEDFIEYITLTIENDIPITIEKSPVEKNAIQLLTYHGSKGREFEYVYLPTLETLKWESAPKKNGNIFVPTIDLLDKEEEKIKKNNELIKLLFVGITRAKHSLTLSYPIAINGKTKKISKLIPFNKDDFEYNSFEYNSEEFLSEKISELIKSDYDYIEELKDYIQERINNLAYSATIINSYQKCPKQFYYSQIMKFAFKNSNKDSMYYGISVHKACEKLLVNAMKNNSYPTKNEFLNYFEENFATQPISTKKCRNDFLERGKNHLSKLYEQLILTHINNLYCAEYEIKEFKYNELNIVGFIDRIEKLDDGTFALYDFKTGSNKTNQIADGKEYEDYLNQLRFYKFIFEKYTNEKVSKTGFIFPDDCSTTCELFLTDEDNNFIEQKLFETKQNIQAMQFDAQPNNPKACELCDYKSICPKQ